MLILTTEAQIFVHLKNKKSSNISFKCRRFNNFFCLIIFTEKAKRSVVKHALIIEKLSFQKSAYFIVQLKD